MKDDEYRQALASLLEGYSSYLQAFVNQLSSVRGKRSRIVILHILEHGSISTEDLENTYGYKHAPRAARDVREQGIALETFKTTNSQGKSIAAYRFGDSSEVGKPRSHGRVTLPKSLKEHLLKENEAKCHICLTQYDPRYLQIDHRVPYAIHGDDRTEGIEPSEYMLVCGSCNRAKSWSCEHCPNWLEEKSVAVCRRCYWASPDDYDHIALTQTRRLAVVWTAEETHVFERLKAKALSLGEAIPDYVKGIISKALRNNRR